MKPAAKITLIYLIFGYAWILISDNVILWFYDYIELETYVYIQTYKGSAFVLVTGVLLYFLTDYYQKTILQNLKVVRNLNKDLDRKAIHLNQVNRNLEQFTYVISHDLQQPLQVIRMTLRQLHRKYGDKLDEKGSFYLKNSEQTVDQMKLLIDKMYNYYEVSAHTSDEISPVDLNLTMDEIRLWNIRLIEQRNALFTWDKLPVLNVSNKRIFRLFEILIRNSLRYAGNINPFRVHVSCKEEEQYLVFRVQDNGPGIAPDKRANIFILFSPDSTGGLTGQSSGLAIVHKIVTGLDGQIEFSSSPETGTVFTIYLPKSLLVE
ncbi:MAG: hypothetical protein LAT75_04490 [Candidatus Cyclonatronum sp.]|uniref:sensor histidine kinase n=1 Tax=Cyclonatronum sp. TaxID=3024185 RepID=UPI0025C1BDC8|nr:ATP-binding protein [Cyclonatronum sp.]MCH8486099.1 hypothetical protein [Cyclonatronum sp.]